MPNEIVYLIGGIIVGMLLHYAKKEEDWATFIILGVPIILGLLWRMFHTVHEYVPHSLGG